MNFTQIEWCVEWELGNLGFPQSTKERVERLSKVVGEGDLVKALRVKDEPIYEIYEMGNNLILTLPDLEEKREKRKNSFSVDPSNWGLIPVK